MLPGTGMLVAGNSVIPQLLKTHGTLSPATDGSCTGGGYSVPFSGHGGAGRLIPADASAARAAFCIWISFVTVGRKIGFAAALALNAIAPTVTSAAIDPRRAFIVSSRIPWPLGSRPGLHLPGAPTPA